MCYFLLQRLRVRRQAVTGSEAVCQSTERNELFQFHVQYTTIQKVCMDSDFTQFEIKKQFHSFIIRHLQKNVQVIWRKWKFSFATRSILICDDIFWSKYKRKYKGIPLNFGPMTCWLAKTQYHFDSFMKKH